LVSYCLQKEYSILQMLQQEWQEGLCQFLSKISFQVANSTRFQFKHSTLQQTQQKTMPGDRGGQSHFEIILFPNEPFITSKGWLDANTSLHHAESNWESGLKSSYRFTIMQVHSIPTFCAWSDPIGMVQGFAADNTCIFCQLTYPNRRNQASSENHFMFKMLGI
jgi:hypothetical protein